MPITPSDFYVHAGELFDTDGASEACLRSVISRAYYAAFLAAREAMQVGAQTRDVHALTISVLLDRGHTGIGNRLQRFRIDRNRADYDLQRAISRNNAGEALKLCRRILDDLGNV